MKRAVSALNSVVDFVTALVDTVDRVADRPCWQDEYRVSGRFRERLIEALMDEVEVDDSVAGYVRYLISEFVGLAVRFSLDLWQGSRRLPQLDDDGIWAYFLRYEESPENLLWATVYREAASGDPDRDMPDGWSARNHHVEVIGQILRQVTPALVHVFVAKLQQKQATE